MIGLEKESFEDFMKRHGYEDGKTNTIEELIFWSSVYTYEKGRNPRRQMLRIRKSIDAAKKFNKWDGK